MGIWFNSWGSLAGLTQEGRKVIKTDLLFWEHCDELHAALGLSCGDGVVHWGEGGTVDLKLVLAIFLLSLSCGMEGRKGQEERERMRGAGERIFLM